MSPLRLQTAGYLRYHGKSSALFLICIQETMGWFFIEIKKDKSFKDMFRLKLGKDT